MDQLDLLKKDWKKQDGSLPKLSFEELTSLIHKKSSSVVKWIFIISVLEFVLPHLILLFPSFRNVDAQMESLHLQNFNIIISVVFYVGALIFVYLFYKNYRSISANSNPKILMQNIIKTRKTVKYYIWFALSMIPIVGGVFSYHAFNTPEFIAKLPDGASMAVVWAVTIVVLLILVGIFWLIYQLIYGRLLNKLKANYNDLISNGNRGNLEDI